MLATGRRLGRRISSIPQISAASQICRILLGITFSVLARTSGRQPSPNHRLLLVAVHNSPNDLVGQVCEVWVDFGWNGEHAGDLKDFIHSPDLAADGTPEKGPGERGVFPRCRGGQFFHLNFGTRPNWQPLFELVHAPVHSLGYRHAPGPNASGSCARAMA